MNNVTLEKANNLKEKIDKIHEQLYSLEKINEQLNEACSQIGLNLAFVNVKVRQAMSSTIGVDKQLTKTLIETTIDYLKQKLDTLKKEYEEL